MTGASDTVQLVVLELEQRSTFRSMVKTSADGVIGIGGKCTFSNSDVCA